MKKILIIIALFSFSCSAQNEDLSKTSKSSSASSRINNAQSGADKILKDLNE